MNRLSILNYCVFPVLLAGLLLAPGLAQAASYTNSASGNWSATGCWVGGAVPPAGGATNAVIVFNPAATDNSTNDLAGAFLVNQLRVVCARAVTLQASGGSSLSFTNAGSALPVVTSVVGGTLTVNSPVTLATNTTMGGSGTVIMAGSITGTVASALTKTGTGRLDLNGATAVGDLAVGYNVNSGSIVAGSGGSLRVGNGAGNKLYVGVTGNAGTLDVSASSNFTATVGNFYVGVNIGAATSVGTLKLGASNTITATKIVMGGNEPDSDSSSSHSAAITTVAGGITTILTPSMAVGTSKGTCNFTLGTNATLNLGAPASRTALIISRSDTWNGYNRPAIGNMNLSAGVAKLYLNSLVIGRKTVGGNSTGYYTGTGTLTLGGNPANHLDISGAGSVVTIGYTSVAGFAGTGNMTIGNLDATSSITSTNNGTAIQIGVGALGNGKLNLLGGSLAITTTGAAIAGGGGTSSLNLNNTTLIAGASSTNWISGLTTATLTNSVTLNTAGRNITIPQPFSGNGSLAKTGAGTLTLSGANTFSGSTTISAGTVALVGSGSLASTNIAIASGAVLDVTGLASYTMPAGKTYTLELLNGPGRIIAGALDITSGRIVLTGTTPSRAGAYMLASYTSLTGSAFASVTGLPPRCALDYNYNNENIIALVVMPRGPVLRIK